MPENSTKDAAIACCEKALRKIIVDIEAINCCTHREAYLAPIRATVNATLDLLEALDLVEATPPGD